MRYAIEIKGYNSGLNELLKSQSKRYDPRTKKTKVWNDEKAKNDKLCREAISKSDLVCGQALVGFKYVTEYAKIDRPIVIHYHFYLANKKHDRMNTFTALDKSFEDALQELGILKNDGFDDVINTTHDFYIDKENPRVYVEIEEIEVETPKAGKKL